MAEPGRLASLLALGWGEASDEDAGNHVRIWPPGSDVREVAEHLARTLEVVYELGEDRCADVVLGQ